MNNANEFCEFANEEHSPFAGLLKEIVEMIGISKVNVSAQKSHGI